MGAVLCETAPSTVTVLTATVRDFTTIIVTLFLRAVKSDP
jgi:hypothetical protein